MPYVNEELKKAYQKRTQTPYMRCWREKNREKHRKYIREYQAKRRKDEGKKKIDALNAARPQNIKKNKEACKKWKSNNRDYERKLTATLADYYIIKQIKKSTDHILKTKDIPKELIELQRMKIIIHRSLKHFL